MAIFKRPFQPACPKYTAGFALPLGILALAFCIDTSVAQKVVDPDSVAPEYRAAAEKRRAEQLKLLQCSKKVDEAKVSKRDRAARIGECIDKGS